MSAMGRRFVIGDVRDEAGQALAQSCGTSGGRAVFHHADVSIGTDFKTLVDRAIKEYGRLDLLLNNAAVAGPYGPIEQVPEEDWDLCIGITLRSVFLGMKYAIPQLRRSGGGATISIASGAAILAEPQQEIMTLRELAVYLRCHPITIYRLAVAGRIPGFNADRGFFTSAPE